MESPCLNYVLVYLVKEKEVVENLLPRKILINSIYNKPITRSVKSHRYMVIHSA